MDSSPELVHPNSFEEYGEYLFIERRENGNKRVLTPVKFYAYDPCPAFVIVSTPLGKKWRCPREELFASPANGKTKQF